MAVRWPRCSWAAWTGKVLLSPRITANGTDYALDFAFYCEKGKMDVETDGDSWHADPKRIPMDNRRDNDLAVRRA